MNRTILFIDGIDGSGKSALAERLVGSLTSRGENPVKLAVDDFRRAVDWNQGDEAEIYFADYFDLGALDRQLAIYLEGGNSIRVPVFDASAERSVGSTETSLENVSLLIIEGVFCQRLRTAPSGSALYLQASEATARKRVLERDIRRGRSRADVSHRIEKRYFPAYRRYVATCEPRQRADLCIDNEDVERPVVLRESTASRSAPWRNAIVEALTPALTLARALPLTRD